MQDTEISEEIRHLREAGAYLAEIQKTRYNSMTKSKESGMTFSQYQLAAETTPQAGRSSVSINRRSFSLLVTHNATSAPLACTSLLIGRDKRYRFGRVGYLQHKILTFQAIEQLGS